MEQLNYHKLVNLKKRMLKYDCESGEKIMKVIDECLVLEKEISKQKANQRQDNYNQEKVKCEVCGKSLLRKSIYKHMATH